MPLFIEASSNFMLNHSLTTGQSPPTSRAALEGERQPTSTTLNERTLPAQSHHPPPAPSEGPPPSGPSTRTDNTGAKKKKPTDVRDENSPPTSFNTHLDDIPLPDDSDDDSFVEASSTKANTEEGEEEKEDDDDDDDEEEEQQQGEEGDDSFVQPSSKSNTGEEEEQQKQTLRQMEAAAVTSQDTTLWEGRAKIFQKDGKGPFKPKIPFVLNLKLFSNGQLKLFALNSLRCMCNVQLNRGCKVEKNKNFIAFVGHERYADGNEAKEVGNFMVRVNADAVDKLHELMDGMESPL